MKHTTTQTVILALSLILGSYMISAQTAEELLPKAIQLEEVKGELENAIEVYKTIVTNFPDNRPIAAKAQFHIGLCYEKLGLKEAQKAYRAVVKNYPEQKNEVALARERLSLLIQMAEKISKTSYQPKFTKINIPTELSWSVKLSPDGKELVLVSDKKLWVMPMSGNLGPEFPGTPVQLNTEGIEVDWTGLAWSGDGKWIAFNEIVLIEKKQSDEKWNQGIYIVSSEGGKPKKIIENYRRGNVINYRISLSPDGKNLAFSSGEKKKQFIYTISVEGGNTKQLTEMEAREPAFSPDGKMIAYVEDKNHGSREGELGLWVVPAQGGAPHLVADAGMAHSPVWSPDGSMIAYLDYSKKEQIFIVPIKKTGKAKGKVTTINAPEGTEDVRLLAGWTPDNKIGALLFTKQERGLYTLPVKGGQAAMVLHDCFAAQPRWSHDGKQIFYITPPLEGKNRMFRLALASVSANGGSGKFLHKGQEGKDIIQITGLSGNRISPDGKMIISAAWTAKDTTNKFSIPKTRIWKIPVDGSESTQITNKQGPYADLCPSWSPNGKSIAFMRSSLIHGPIPFGETSIYTVNFSGGEPDLLITESKKFIYSPVWSPDGKMIAYLTTEKEAPNYMPNTSNMNVINVFNGESRVVGEVPAFGHIELAWSPDSKRIAFNEVGIKAIKVMSLSDGSIEDIETGLVDAYIYHLDWSPDGERFVFGGATGGNKEFWTMENFLPKEEKSNIQK